MTTLKTLTTYYKMGFSLMPVNKDSKKALLKWKPYIYQRPSMQQIEAWVIQYPDAKWAVITGKISGILIVDCDNPAALQVAEDLGLTNSCSVKTKHGYHFYFKYLDDGKARKNISGSNSPGTYWPQINGLDLRSSGGYAVIPPSQGYEWEIELEDIPDEMTMYQDWNGATFPDDPVPATNPHPINPTLSSFGGLDLSNTALEGDGKKENTTRKKYEEIAAQYPTGLIPRGGSGIHDATYRFMSEELLFVGMGPALEEAGRKFMDDYFETPLADGRFEASLKTLRDKERLNHPERFNESGVYVHHLKDKADAAVLNLQPKSLLAKAVELHADGYMTDEDSDQFADGFDVECWQSPWLPKASIIQVYGYSGHGKSMFLQHALHHAACGLHFGPFEAGDKPKILYLDFENGKSTWGRRVHQMKTSFGKAGDNLLYWTPWLGGEQISLKSNEGISALSAMLKEHQPDILVIDTVRTAFPGLNENNAEDWSSINQLALRIRNAGCTVVLVHHSNKPSGSGLGREAGSSNQLTTLETQVRITQVMNDPVLAKTKGALYAYDLEYNPFEFMKTQMPKTAHLQMVFEISYGKVREWTDLHEPKQYIGIAQLQDGRSLICYSKSPKNRLRSLINKGISREAIINTMQRPSKVLDDWAKKMKLDLPK